MLLPVLYGDHERPGHPQLASEGTGSADSRAMNPSSLCRCDLQLAWLAKLPLWTLEAKGPTTPISSGHQGSGEIASP